MMSKNTLTFRHVCGLTIHYASRQRLISPLSSLKNRQKTAIFYELLSLKHHLHLGFCGKIHQNLAVFWGFL
jgi:hypothetical protein